MTPDAIKRLLAKGEGIDIEFKESSFKLNKSTFDSVCAFLNRKGGHLLLGVADNGTVTGVLDDSVEDIILDFVNCAGNPNKLNPVFYLAPEIIELDGSKVIYVWIPESSQVHQNAGKILDRNQDGDFDITNQQELVSQLHLRKQKSYTENTIYPALSLTDLREDLFQKVRKLARSQRPNHPWLAMDDLDMLRSAGLFKKDYQTGQEGFTLAAALLLGRDEVIQSILPHYKTDAIFRVSNIDRYDDRDDIRTNLIDAYERLMAFVSKHLPEKFYQEGRQRVNAREQLFHEVVANLLVHREYANPYPAKLIIELTKVITENWNKPHGSGIIDPSLFTPYPKNPVIARFFKEIGRVEELGSGVRNMYRYGKIYSNGNVPEFIEGDIFISSIPVEYSILHIDFEDNLPIDYRDESNQVNSESNQVSGKSNQVSGKSNQVNDEKATPAKQSFNTKIKYIETSKKLLSLISEIKKRDGWTEEDFTALETLVAAKNNYWLPLLNFAKPSKSRRELLQYLGLSNQTKNFKKIIAPLIEAKLLQRTILHNPNDRNQQYYTTAKGEKLIRALQNDTKNTENMI